MLNKNKLKPVILNKAWPVYGSFITAQTRLILPESEVRYRKRSSGYSEGVRGRGALLLASLTIKPLTSPFGLSSKTSVSRKVTAEAAVGRLYSCAVGIAPTIAKQYSTDSRVIQKSHTRLPQPARRPVYGPSSGRRALDESLLLDMGRFGSKSTGLKTSIEFEPMLRTYSVLGELSTAQKHCLQKFINLCMKHGKKNKSYKIISNTLRRLSLLPPDSTSSNNPVGEEPRGLPEALCVPFFVGGPNKKCPKGALRNTEPNRPSGVFGAFGPKIEDSRFTAIGRACVSTRSRLILLVKAIENVKPIIEVKKVRISGTTQLVPSIIPKNRQICLAIRWIIEAAILRRNTKKSMTIDQCFFAELIDASQNIGTVRKRRDDLHKLAESNRGFAHYRWWA